MTIIPGNSATTSGGSGTDVVVTKPTGVVAGDVMVAIVGGQVASDTFTVSAPSGWVEMEVGSSGTLVLYMFLKVAGGSEPADYTFTYSVSVAQRRAGIQNYIHVDNTTPQDAAATGNTGPLTTATGLSITTVTDNAWLVLGVATQAAVTITPPTGFTERYVSGRANFQDDEQTSAGASGNKDATLSSNSTWVTVMGALRPAVASNTGLAYDAGAQSSVADASSLTFSHTVSGSNRVLYVGVSILDSNDANRPVTSVTYNGVALTKVNHSDTGSGTSERAELWCLIAPATGTNNVVITTTGTVSRIIGWSDSFTGARQSDQPALSTTTNGSGSTSSASLTTDEDGLWIIDAMSSEANITSANSGQTLRHEVEPQSFQTGGASTSGAFPSGQTKTHGYTHDYGARWRMVIAAIAPASASSDVSISKSETVTVSENKVVTVSDPQVTKSEAVSVAESVTPRLESHILENESVTVAETVKADLQSHISKTETVSLAENVTADVSDPQITKSEAVSVSETTKTEVTSFINKNEAVSVSESVVATLSEPQVIKTESVSVAETTKLEVVSFITKSEDVSVAESVAVERDAGSAVDRNVSVSESIGITEAKTLLLESHIAKSENVSLSEATKTEIESHIRKSESVSIAEAVTTTVSAPQITKSENVSIAESVTANVSDPQVSRSESVGVSEATNILLTSHVAKSESVSVAGSTKTEITSFVNKSEAVGVTEAVTADVSDPQIAVSESVSVTDTGTVVREDDISSFFKNAPFYFDIGGGLSMMLGQGRVATWNTNGRPSSPKRGTVGLNTQLNQLEIYNGSAWYKVAMTAI